MDKQQGTPVTHIRVAVIITLTALWLSACGGGGGGGAPSDTIGTTPDNTNNTITTPTGTSTGSSSDVSTAGPGWSTGQAVSTKRDFYGTDVYAAAADINDTGTGVVLWVEEGDEPYLWVNVRRNGAWGTPKSLGGKGSWAPQVAVAPSGNAVVIWTQREYDANGFWIKDKVYSARYDHANGTWTVPEQISVDSTDNWATAGSIAMDANGNAIALWEHGYQVWARCYLPATGWEVSPTQLSNSPRGVHDMQIVVDGSNVFTAVWIEDTTAYDSALLVGGPNHPTAYASRFTGGSWSMRQRIGWADADLTGNFDSASRLRVDANAAGHVFAIWEQGRVFADNTFHPSVDAVWFNPGTETWSAPQIIAQHDTYLSWPQIAVDGAGNALAVWNRTETLGGNVSSVRAARFTAGDGTWGAEALIDETGTGDVSYVVMAMDAAGNAQVVWRELGKGMVARRFDAAGGAGWGGFVSLTPAASRLVLDMSDTGYGLLLGDYTEYASTTFLEAAWAWIFTP